MKNSTSPAPPILPPVGTCTPEFHATELVHFTRRAYVDGHHAGVLHGHRRGFDEGYIAGFNDGTRSSSAFKAGQADGFVTGYLERLGDEQAKARGGRQ